MNNRIDVTDEPNDGLLEHLERSLIAGRLSRRGFMRAATAAGFGTVGLHALADELDAIRANQTDRAKKLQEAYDYVVVGTGTAACALVGRLATRPLPSWILLCGSPTWALSAIGVMSQLHRPAPITALFQSTWDV
jgi:choline dehydrogenase